MATPLYCERGACGPDGTGWFCCRSSDFFSESRMPPLVGGTIGVAGPAGCDCEGGLLSRIELGLRSEPASQASHRLVRKKPTARTAVVRVSKLAVPRLDMKPAPPPTPRPPPSDFCSSTVAISVATIIRWTTITTVCISTFHHKLGGEKRGRTTGLRGLKSRGVTRLDGAMSPPIGPCRPANSSISSYLGAARRNRKEIGRFQAGAAHQRAIDVRNFHQFPGVRGFYRAAIEDTHFSPFTAKPCGEEIPDKPMYLLDISNGRGQAGADRPDRLIGHHQIVGVSLVRQGKAQLSAADVEGLPGIALMLGFADADDGGEAGAPDRFGLLSNQHVSLAVIAAPLGVADNDSAGAGIGQHFG